MAGHGRRLSSGRKGDPRDRAVIKAAVSLEEQQEGGGGTSSCGGGGGRNWLW